MQSALRGNLRVSIPIDFGNARLSRAMAEFIRAHPDIHLEMDANSRAVNPREDPYDIVIQFGAVKSRALPTAGSPQSPEGCMQAPST